MTVGVLSVIITLSFIVGVLIGWWWARHRLPRPLSTEVQIKVRDRGVHELPRRTVHFRAADGHTDVKTLFEHSLAPTVPWRGRLYRRQADQSGVAIYQE